MKKNIGLWECTETPKCNPHSIILPTIDQYQVRNINIMRCDIYIHKELTKNKKWITRSEFGQSFRLQSNKRKVINIIQAIKTLITSWDTATRITTHWIKQPNRRKKILKKLRIWVSFPIQDLEQSSPTKKGGHSITTKIVQKRK